MRTIAMASADKAAAEHTIYQSHVLNDYKVMQGGMPLSFMVSACYSKGESTCIVLTPFGKKSHSYAVNQMKIAKSCARFISERR